MVVRTLALVFTVGFFTLAPIVASSMVPVNPDSTDQLTDPPVEDSYHPKRKPNGELVLGWMTTNALYDLSEDVSVVIPGSFYQIGWGGAIPLIETGPISTVWLKASAIFGIGWSEDEWGEQEPQFDITIPIHAVFSYGALRRRSVAWGGSVGLGANVGRRFQFDQFTVAPSAIFEVLYAPRNVYGLRLLVDLLPASINDQTGYHTWSVQFLIGL